MDYHGSVRCEAELENQPVIGDEPSESTTGDAMEHLSDRSLLRRFHDGEQDAATALYLRYAKRLHRLADAQTSPEIAVRVDPEGIVQSVFRTFFRRVSQGQYDIPQGEDLWKLFLVIALNKIRTRAAHHRADKRDVSRTHPLPADGLIASGSDEAAFALLRMTIEELLAEMPETNRQVVLWRIEGQEVAEIASRTHRSKRSVERILQKFRERLGQLVHEE